MASENGQENRGTLADIVEEMRTRSREVKEAFGGKPDGVENMLDIWADRIEAIDSADAWRSLYTPPVGNAAAMRDALVEALNKVNDVYDILSKPCVTLEEARQACREARGIIIPALSAPARNCDVYANDAEAQFACLGESLANGVHGMSLAEYHKWLFAEAKGEYNESKKEEA